MSSMSPKQDREEHHLDFIAKLHKTRDRRLREGEVTRKRQQA